jgi:thiol:disulfide interchange protein DsbD
VDYGPGHAVPRLLSETASVTPGEPFTLGVTFDIEPRWHLYWNGLNDTGYPIQVQPELPEGFRPGDLQWPAPERKISPGDILDHVYSGRVTLLLPVHPPRDLEPGSEVTLVCRLDWLACKEVCVPGQGVASVTLAVRGPAGGDGERERRRAAETAGGEETLRRFREARERLPVPATVPPPGVRWTWTEGAFVVEADGARRLAFYPYLDSAPLASLLRDGASETGRLTLHPAENPGTPGVLSGVLEIDPGPPGRSTFHALAIPPNENP